MERRSRASARNRFCEFGTWRTRSEKGSAKPKITPARAKSEGAGPKSVPEPASDASSSSLRGAYEILSPKRTETPSGSRGETGVTATETMLLAQLSRLQGELDEMKRRRRDAAGHH